MTESNPIFELAKRVKNRELALALAEKEVLAKRITDKDLLELTAVIIKLLDDDLFLALLCSSLRMKYWNAVKRSKDIFWAHCHFVHGDVLRLLGRFQEALQCFSDCRNFYIKTAVIKGVASCDINMGIIYACLGSSKKAVELLESARGILEERGSCLDLATCYLNLGCAYSDLANHPKALEFLQLARKLSERLADDLGLAKADLNIGNVWRELGDTTEALELLQSARRKYERLASATGTAKADVNIGHCYRDAGEPDKALAYYQSARKTYERLGSAAEIAKADLNIGILYSELGDSKKALELLQSARKVHERGESKLVLAKVIHYMAVAHAYLGDYGKALELLRSARKTYERLGNESRLADCEIAIGMVHTEEGQFGKAIKAYESARKSYEVRSNEIGLAHCNLGMGNIHSDLGDYEKSVNLYRLAKEGYEKRFHETGIADCNLNVGLLQSYLGNHTQALDLLQSARRTYQKRGLVRQLAQCDLNLSILWCARDDLETALDLTNSAKQAFTDLGMQHEINKCDLSIASIEARLGHHDQALVVLQRIISECKDIFPIYWRCLYVTGICWWAKEEIDKAESSLVEAVGLIEKIRGWLPNHDIRGAFLVEVRQVYHTLIAILLEKRECAIALEYVERLKSRRLAELLAGRDLQPRNATEREIRVYRKVRNEMLHLAQRLSKEQDRIRAAAPRAEYEEKERCYNGILKSLQVRNPDFDPDQTSNISFREINSLVPDEETVIIELFPMEDKTVVFVVRKGENLAGSTELVCDFTMSNLLSHVDRLAEMNEAAERAEENQQEDVYRDCIWAWENYLADVLERLYEKLFHKIKPHLEGIHQLVFIPYSGFHLLPLHAMYAQENGVRRHIIDDYTVRYAPSTKILSHVSKTRRPGPAKVVVASADPPNPGDKHWSPLQFSPREASLIRDLFHGDLVPDATRTRIVDSAREAHIFHYTGHASEDGLWLHSDDDSEKPGEWYELGDIFATLDLTSASLATLSACETGKTKLGQVDEYIGLSAGFLHAGASTVISSLWKVPDASTYLLMGKMYELIKQGQSKAQALREAQCWLKSPAPDITKEQRDTLLKLLLEKGTRGSTQGKGRGGRVLPPHHFDAKRPEMAEESVDNLIENLNRLLHWAPFFSSGAP